MDFQLEETKKDLKSSRELVKALTEQLERVTEALGGSGTSDSQKKNTIEMRMNTLQKENQHYKLEIDNLERELAEMKVNFIQQTTLLQTTQKKLDESQAMVDRLQVKKEGSTTDSLIETKLNLLEAKIQVMDRKSSTNSEILHRLEQDKSPKRVRFNRDSLTLYNTKAGSNKRQPRRPTSNKKQPKDSIILQRRVVSKKTKKKKGRGSIQDKQIGASTAPLTIS